MANNYTSTAKVRLYDQRSNTILLHPETELSAVVCESGGILTINGNSIYVDPADVGPVVSGSGFIQEPTIEYTTGGTVTNVGNSAGYGTLLKTIDTIDHIRGTTAATNGYLPTELAVATALETKQNTLAAGSFITLSAPQADTGIVTISVPYTNTISGSTASLDSVIPTAQAVNAEILRQSANAVTAAMTSVSAAGYATETWTAANFVPKGGAGDWGYATYASAGVVKPIQGSGIEIVDSGAIKLGSATTAAIGGVAVPANHGLSITGGSLAITAAGTTAAAIGGVYVPAGSGLAVANDGKLTGNIAAVSAGYNAQSTPGMVKGVLSTVVTNNTYAGSAYVPNVQAVYNYVSGQINGIIAGGTGSIAVAVEGVTTWVNQNFAPASDIPGDANYATKGIVSINSNGLSVVSGHLSLLIANGSTIGGVMVPDDQGLTLTAATGELKVTKAPVVATYDAASTLLGSNTVGGVVVMNTVTGATTTAQESLQAVPTAHAVTTYVENALANVQINYAGPFAVTGYTGSDEYNVTIAGGYIYANGSTVAVCEYAGQNTSDVSFPSQASGVNTVWLVITLYDGTVSAQVGPSWVYDATHTSIPLAALYYDHTVVQYQYGDIVLAGDPGAVAGQGGGGGAPVYDGEFAVTCPNSGTYSIAGGTMYVDGTSLSGTISTAASFTGTANGTIWANIYKSGNSLTGVYAATRSISGSTCSVPIAKVNGTSVTQYQYGPIRIEGRWA